jgi:7-cyano-7-deazaguanine synthase
MKTLVIASGGMDSSVLVYHLRKAGDDVAVVSFDYGQRHGARELAAARRLYAEELGMRHDIIRMTEIGALLSGDSALVTAEVEVPEGHYESESMKATVVPNRNMIMLAIARGIAGARKMNRVAYAAHAGDHAIYPDCRPDFFEALSKACSMADWSGVTLCAPFIAMSKADICGLGGELDVPFEETWSCYKGGELHCGKCGTCTERREAFVLSGVEDVTRYEEA